MFKALFGGKDAAVDAHALYGSVVARAREPLFYAKLGVPDTFDGRFEMLVMHLFVLHARLKDEAKPVRKVSQLVFDNFLQDMDSALRELGVGDQTVPKRIKKMTQVFYGRTGAYQQALAVEEDQARLKAIGHVINRNLFPDGGGEDCSQRLGEYMIRLVKDLAAMDVAELVGQVNPFNGTALEREMK